MPVRNLIRRMMPFWRKRTYIFFGKEGWYPVELGGDADVLPNVKCNPGTIRVEDIDGRVVWKQEASNADDD